MRINPDITAHEMKTLSNPAAIIAIIVLFAACAGPEKIKPIKIAISQGVPEKPYANYINWLKSVDSTVECFDMYHMRLDQALLKLDSCSGLLVTGGGDVFPGLYGKPDDTLKADKPDNHRDSLELALIARALKNGMPILGICRGQQMLNVAMGGTLIVDIPTDYGTTVEHKCEDYLNCGHPVRVLQGSLLNDIAGVTDGFTNTNHHQAIEKIAPAFRAIAFSEDNIIESIQWDDPVGKPFLLGVQWHPERMDLKNPLCGKIAERFLAEARKYNPED
jgi:putative glutamine amidotransferase